MKNFPHQINQLPRLTNAIGVFAQLIERNHDVDDDGEVGDALAISEVYTFRNPGAKTIEELLQFEHSKTPANQGTRTCARELRRFFILLGFIRRTRDGSWEISPSARALLALNLKDQRAAADDIWRQALLNMELTDAGESSHPYQILLRLVVAMPGLPKPYSGLCLEARNDTEKEFERIRRIAAKANPTETMNALAGAHMPTQEPCRVRRPNGQSVCLRKSKCGGRMKTNTRRSVVIIENGEQLTIPAAVAARLIANDSIYFCPDCGEDIHHVNPYAGVTLDDIESRN
jgi:hypothetical protein